MLEGEKSEMQNQVDELRNIVKNLEEQNQSSGDTESTSKVVRCLSLFL